MLDARTLSTPRISTAHGSTATAERPAPWRTPETPRPAQAPVPAGDPRDGVVILAPDGRVLSASAGILAMAGLSAEDLAGAHPPLPLWPQEDHRLLDAFWAKLACGAEGVLRCVVIDASGARVAGESDWWPIRDDAGTLIAYAVSVREAPAPAGDADAPVAGPSRLDALAAVMREGVMVVAPDGRVTVCNDAACEILGSERERILGGDTTGESWRLVSESGSALPRGQRPWTTTLLTGVPRRDVVRGLDVPGRERRWISVSSVPAGEPDDLGRPSEVVVTLVDVTDERAHREAFHGERGLARSLIGAMCEGLMVLDAAGRLVDVNERMCTMLGCEREDVIGSTMPFAWIPPADRETVARALATTLEGDGNATATIEMHTAEGGPMPFALTVRRREDAVSPRPGYVMTVRDSACSARGGAGCDGAPAAAPARRRGRR